MLSIRELTNKIITRELKVKEVVLEYLKVAASSQLNSYITVVPEKALAQADKLDSQLAKGEAKGALIGVPLAIKDLIVTQGIRSTGGSKILENYLPPYDATVVKKIESAGAIILGKTNCDEFAMGSSGENSAYGPTKNPWDVARVPGGSSSGSAAAVAANECLAALGTDTGGSIRQPASFCGVVGVKPTYGRVSRFGLMAMTSSLDQAGPIARTVEDAAFMLKAMAGHDPYDATSSTSEMPDYVGELPKSIKGIKVGVAKEFFSEGLDTEVKSLVAKAIDKIKSLGGEIIDVTLPSLPYALAAYYIICPSEVSANMARYDGIRYGVREKNNNLLDLYTHTRGHLLGAEVKRRVMLGTFVLSAGYYDAYYRRAQFVRQAIKKEFQDIFSKVDVLASPTAPTPAYKLGSKVTSPLAMYLGDSYTVPVNIAGLPAVSVPCGFTTQALPVGLQLIGPSWSEAKLLQLAYHYEQSENWYKQQPPGTKPKF